MWGAFVGLISQSLDLLNSVLGSWGLAIILFTIAVKVLTWPLTAKQLKSSRVMQELAPRQRAIQERYKDDKEIQTREMMKLYQEVGFNPLSGCLPTLVQFPIWIGLYQAIANLATDGKLDEGFLFLRSLAFPNTQVGMGWVTDVANLGQNWPYLILPILTIVTQIGVSKLMTPATTANSNSDDPTAAMMKQMNTIMPIMFGFFALQFPAGLALYWVTSNVLTYIQYAVTNRLAGPALTLAPVAADGKAIIDVKPARAETPKGQNDARTGRKRKKR